VELGQGGFFHEANLEVDPDGVDRRFGEARHRPCDARQGPHNQSCRCGNWSAANDEQTCSIMVCCFTLLCFLAFVDGGWTARPVGIVGAWRLTETGSGMAGMIRATSLSLEKVLHFQLEPGEHRPPGLVC
jgi:hypothetical protein